MKRTHVLGLLVAALLAGLIGWRSALGSKVDPLTYYAPDRFVDKADRFIADGYLRADCRDGVPRLVEQLDNAPDEDETWYEESYLQGDVRRYNADPVGYAWTFLIDGNCKLRGVHPAVHTIELPFHQRLLWLGDILYRGRGADSTLRSARRTISLSRPEDPPLEPSSVTLGRSRDVLGPSMVRLNFSGNESRPAAQLFHLGDEVVLKNREIQGRDDATHLLGHQLKVGRWARLDDGDWLSFESRDFSKSSETFVFQGGESKRIASTVRRQNDRYERRTDDAGLGQVPDPGRDAAYPYLDQVAKTIDRLLSIFPDDEAKALSDAFDLQLTIDRELQVTTTNLLRREAEALRRSRDLAPFSAGITVMDGVTGDLLALATYPTESDLRDVGLDARARRRALQNQNFVLHPIGSAVKPYLFAAAAQAHPELLAFEIAGHAPTRRFQDIFQCRIPTGYQLLEGHWQEWIDYETALQISCNRYTIELLTLALAAQQADSRGLSSTLALDRDLDWPPPGRPPSIRLAGRPIDAAPDLGGFFFLDRIVEPTTELASTRSCRNLASLDEASWRLPLGNLTGADTYRGLDPREKTSPDPTRRELELGYLSNRYDLAPWMPLIEDLSERLPPDESSQTSEDGTADDLSSDPSPDDSTIDRRSTRTLEVRTTLQEVAPERVNLALNQITDIRADYISLMLGGGTSIWTNVQLSEALARLVTGREVVARFVDSLPPRARTDDDSDDSRPPQTAPRASPEEERRTLPPALKLRSEVRARTLEGMRRVVEGTELNRGTAQALKDELTAIRKANPQSTVVLYSKTGSPILEKSVPAAHSEALSELVRRGRLVWNGSDLVALPDEGASAAWADRSQTGRQAFVTALRQGLAEVGYRRSSWIRSTMLRVVDEFALDLADATSPSQIDDAPLAIEGGQLVVDRTNRFFSDLRSPGKGGIYHFALVKLPGTNRPLPPTEADLADPRTEITVVTIHLEAEDGSEDAVALAEKLVSQLF